MDDKIQTLQEIIQRQRWDIARLTTLVERDELTGLLNRSGFSHRVGKILTELQKQAGSEELHERKFEIRNMALLFVDVNDFKSVNDTHGHETGDACLKEMAEVLESSVRDLDIVGRWSGDEFIIGLLGASCEEGIAKANTIKEKFVQAREGRNQKYPLPSVSIGVAAVHEQDKSEYDLAKLIARADERMYQDKKNKTR